jgi:NADH-quinone oxidoreductase subunit G
MSEDLVTIHIDGKEVSVPKGTLIVDAAKQVGIDIPVFCYHPKLEPVGMCRMCLVEIGRPAWDRAKNEPVLDDEGNPVIRYGPNLETACTTPVGDGWVVLVDSGRALEERKQVIEFLLTSHPLDCPVCDKGGECPLQNLTMQHGPGKSRFIFDDKMHLDKHVPLGDLIFLDRERCIQCGRCVRFQEEIVGEPVIGFSERGRELEIVTFSEPGFNSYFSGNTTDICPVGALTTADFRFGARPWELNATASICPHCPVGCNLVLNTRREARAGGNDVVKRVMPRQNEAVNEIWICDKGRFAHHFVSSSERLTAPLMRVRGKLVEVSWEKALAKAAKGLKSASKTVGIAGGRVSNEDLFTFRSLIEAIGGKAVLDTKLAGGEYVQRVGVGKETDLGKLGAGDAVLVVASDLQEEAPIWWLRVKQAAERGATLVVANGRGTRLDTHASHVLRFPYSEAVETVLGMLQTVSRKKDLKKFSGSPEIKEAAKALANADNLVIFFGGDGLDRAGSQALAQACASFLVATKHSGRANNGLIGVWDQNNTMGAWDMGLAAATKDMIEVVKDADAAYVMAADPLGDPSITDTKIDSETFIVVQDLFLTETAKRADVVFPASSFIERDGTFTTGERRVQRFYPAVSALGECLPDWRIVASLAGELGIEMEASSAAAVFSKIAESAPGYEHVSYQELAKSEAQWPYVGGEDLYFGGTAYTNEHGLGVQIASGVERGEAAEIEWTEPRKKARKRGILMVPVTKLYDSGTGAALSDLLKGHITTSHIILHPDDADRLKISDESQVEVSWDGRTVRLYAQVTDMAPTGVALLARGREITIRSPVEVQVDAVS